MKDIKLQYLDNISWGELHASYNDTPCDYGHLGVDSKGNIFIVSEDDEGFFSYNQLPLWNSNRNVIWCDKNWNPIEYLTRTQILEKIKQ
jgi:hypothetical protein